MGDTPEIMTPVSEPELKTKTSTASSTNSTDNAYTEAPGLTALPQSEVDKFLTDNFISVTDPLPSFAKLRPLTNFDFLPITDPAQKAPFKNFKAPTPIQAAAWPFLFSGRDVIGVAETGSGKTMAFAVPCVRGILSLPASQRNKGPRAVIVSPTRELAMQSYDQIMELAKVSGLKAVCVYGGVPKDRQRRRYTRSLERSDQRRMRGSQQGQIRRARRGRSYVRQRIRRGDSQDHQYHTSSRQPPNPHVHSHLARICTYSRSYLHDQSSQDRHW